MTVVEVIVALLGAGGIGNLAWTLLTSRTANKKTRVDGAVVLVDSAANYAAGLVKRIDDITADFDSYKDRQNALWREQAELNERRVREKREQERLFRVHTRWDHAAVEELASKGINLDPPPPLYMEQTGDHL